LAGGFAASAAESGWSAPQIPQFVAPGATATPQKRQMPQSVEGGLGALTAGGFDPLRPLLGFRTNPGAPPEGAGSQPFLRAVPMFTRTFLRRVNVSRARTPCSNPTPLDLTPANGVCG